jgi:hypothetical protein
VFYNGFEWVAYFNVRCTFRYECPSVAFSAQVVQLVCRARCFRMHQEMACRFCVMQICDKRQCRNNAPTASIWLGPMAATAVDAAQHAEKPTSPPCRFCVMQICDKRQCRNNAPTAKQERSTPAKQGQSCLPCQGEPATSVLPPMDKPTLPQTADGEADLAADDGEADLVADGEADLVADGEADLAADDGEADLVADGEADLAVDGETYTFDQGQLPKEKPTLPTREKPTLSQMETPTVSQMEKGHRGLAELTEEQQLSMVKTKEGTATGSNFEQPTADRNDRRYKITQPEHLVISFPIGHTHEVLDAAWERLRGGGEASLRP